MVRGYFFIRLFKYRLTRLLVCAAAFIGHISKPIKAALRLEIRHTHERRLNMNATCVKKALIEEIQDISASPELYCHNPTRDFSRNRKLPFETLVSLILNMNGGTLTNELLNYFAFSPDTVSSSAFVQQRSKLKASAFRMLMLGFNKHMEEISPVKTLNGLRLLAVDGTDLHPPTNPEDQDSYFPGDPEKT